MPRMYLSARGEVIDFDAHLIKQAIAAKPMTVDVEKRKTFIDSKEVRKKTEAAVTAQPTAAEPTATPVEKVLTPTISVLDDFDAVNPPAPAPTKKK